MNLLSAAVGQGPAVAQAERHSGRKVRMAQGQELLHQGQGMLGVVAAVQEQLALHAWVLGAEQQLGLRNATVPARVAVAMAAVAAEQEVDT